MAKQYDEQELKRLCECVGKWWFVDSKTLARHLADRLEELAGEMAEKDEDYRGHLRQVYGVLGLHWQNRGPLPILAKLRNEAGSLRAWADSCDKPKEPTPKIGGIVYAKDVMGVLCCAECLKPLTPLCPNCGQRKE